MRIIVIYNYKYINISILVDDFSGKDYLGRPLQEYVRNFPIPVLLARTLSRVGLIQARLLGASKATVSLPFRFVSHFYDEVILLVVFRVK